MVLGLSVLTVVAMPRRVSRRLTHTWLLLTGRLVDVGGHRLHIQCRGSGSPTVIFDSGLNMTMSSWGEVPSTTSAFTRVCTYDRAGLDFSERGPTPRTSKRIAEELHILLERTATAGPFVLVGHSFGALNVRLYSSLYPTEVSGIVLIDPSYEGQYQRFAALKDGAERDQYLKHESGGNYEGIDLIASGLEVRNAPHPPSVPIIIVSAKPNESEDRRLATAITEIQSELAQRLPLSKQVFVENTGHFIHLDHPDLVTNLISDVVSTARNHRSSL
jgi:pimeloyl-ACP methyl ester carboxylesterase